MWGKCEESPRPTLVIGQKKFIFLIFLIMPKIGLRMPTAKNRFQILNLHPKKHSYIFKKVLKEKITKRLLINYLQLKFKIENFC